MKKAIISGSIVIILGLLIALGIKFLFNVCDPNMTSTESTKDCCAEPAKSSCCCHIVNCLPSCKRSAQAEIGMGIFNGALRTVKVINGLDKLQLIITILTLVIAIITLIFINKIMVNQIYANLIADYRSPEMGAAILALFNFYKKDCKLKVSKIKKRYIKRYKKEVKPLLKKVKKHQKPQKADFSNTLHFQRRMVAQFYFDMAVLRFEHCFLTRLSKRILKKWFTPNDVKLLSLILYMAKPAKKVFIEVDSLSEPPENNVPMNVLIRKLYDLVKKII